jgi:Protein of unknown function (DUF3224)
MTEGMSRSATSTFEVKSWDEKTVNDVDGKLKVTRATVVFAYQGDLVGQSSMEYVMAYREDASATVLGLERVSGQLDGKAGTFVLESRGGYADGTASGALTVVEGSGTGELAGIRGHGKSTATSDGKTAFELEYEIR